MAFVKLTEADKHPEHYEPCVRGDGELREWSIGIGDAIHPGKPARLFVRFWMQLIAVSYANVTSWNREAREIESGESTSVTLGRGDARWLLTVLPEALAILEAEHPTPEDK